MSEKPLSPRANHHEAMKKSERFFFFGNHREMRISKWFPKERTLALLHDFMVDLLLADAFHSGLGTQTRFPTVIR